MKNTGQSEARDIKINFEKIINNGEVKDFKLLDEVFKNEMTLYPNEKIVGRVTKSGSNIFTNIAPVISVEISYVKGNTRKKEQYNRNICYSGETDNPI